MIVYLAHPVAPTPDQFVGAAPGVGDIIVLENLDRARRWLVLHTDWCISAPWMPYVQALGEDGAAMRERGLRDMERAAALCDAIVLCGGRTSSGMARERDAAHRAGKAILSLVDLGPEPTAYAVLDRMGIPSASIEAMLRGRMREALGG